MAPRWTKFLLKNQENKAVTAVAEAGLTRMRATVEGTQAAAQAGVERAAQPVHRKTPSVTEMIEYVRGLGIDPVAEENMLWIAEEALHAPLPPGWSEHQDDQGTIFFHNMITNESSWRHPMDAVFHDVVGYQRRVIKDEGFWNVDDELGRVEEEIRKELAAWMELYDEHGEKFFYNKNTEMSRFDDPRMGVYHMLYARIRMVAKMKERLPEQAQAKPPLAPTPEELERKRKQIEQELLYVQRVVKIQAVAREMLERKRKKHLLAAGVVSKGPQPLSGKMYLKMENVEHVGRDLVLRQTTPYRKDRAASKIQARIRGCLIRRRFRPLVNHRVHLGRRVTRIQAMARVWLARRRCNRLRIQREVDAVQTIQRRWKGRRDRKYVNVLRAEKAKFDFQMKCILKLQSLFRQQIAKKKVGRMLLSKHTGTILEIQRRAKVFSARKILEKREEMMDNIKVRINFTEDPQARRIYPWTLEVLAAPWDPQSAEGPESKEAQEGTSTNLFWKEAPDQFEEEAAVRIQTSGHGMLARKRVRNLRDCCTPVIDGIISDAVDWANERNYHATKMQKAWRSMRLLKMDLLKKKMFIFLKKQSHQAELLQAYCRQYNEQAWLKLIMVEGARLTSSIQLQAAWRGYLARKHADNLRMETLWPLKGFFQYNATGSSSVQADLVFRINPFFDKFKYFAEHGGPDPNLAFEKSVRKKESIFERKAKPAEEPAAPERKGSVAATKDSKKKVLPPSAGSKRGTSSRASSRGGSRGGSRGSSAERKQDRTGSARRNSEVPDGKPGSRSGTREEGRPPRLPTGKSTSNRPSVADESDTSPAAPTETDLPMETEPVALHETAAEPAAEPAAQAAAEQDVAAGAPAAVEPQPVAATGAAKEAAAAPAATPAAKVIDDDDDDVAGSVAGSDEDEDGPKKKGGGMIPDAVFSFAQAFLRTAGTKYEDIKELRKPKKAPPAAPTAPVVSGQEEIPAPVEMEDEDEKPKPKNRKSYAGKLQNGKFTKTNVDYETMTEAQKQAILKDIDRLRLKKEKEMTLKRTQLDEQKEKVAADALEAYNAQCAEAKAIQIDRRGQELEEMEKWHKEKKAQSKAKRRKDHAMMAVLREKDAKKAESIRKVEESQEAGRLKRLHIAEMRNSIIETQLAASRAMRSSKRMGASTDDFMGAKGFAPPVHPGMQHFAPGMVAMPGMQGMFPGASPGMPMAMPRGGPMGMPPPPGMMGPMPMMGGTPGGPPEIGYPGGGPGGMPGVPQQMAARMMHRHVHHHLHYHDGDGNESADGPSNNDFSHEDQQRLEAASEARVQSQMMPPGGPFDPAAFDDLAETRAGGGSWVIPPGADLARTQPAFRRHASLPQLDPRGGLPGFQRSFGRAFDSYSDNGRPRFVHRQPGASD